MGLSKVHIVYNIYELPTFYDNRGTYLFIKDVVGSSTGWNIAFNSPVSGYAELWFCFDNGNAISINTRTINGLNYTKINLLLKIWKMHSYKEQTTLDILSDIRDNLDGDADKRHLLDDFLLKLPEVDRLEYIVEYGF